MAHAVAQRGAGLMAGPQEFETFYAASYRRLGVQLLGVTGNLHDLAVSAARRSRRFLAATARAGAGQGQEVPGLSTDDLDLVAAADPGRDGQLPARPGADGPAPGPRRRGGGLPCRTMS